MKPPSYLDKASLPYSLLLDPTTGHAAAYTSNHRLITDHASADLVAFALANIEHQAAYDPARQDPHGQWRPLPPWATPDVLPRLQVVWIRRAGGDAGDDAWRAIPPR